MFSDISKTKTIGVRMWIGRVGERLGVGSSTPTSP